MAVDECERITLRSLVRRRVCFGGFRRRTWRYHGLCPWGSIFVTKRNSAKLTTMDESTIIRQLEALAVTFGLQIRYEPIRIDEDLPNVPGGVCRLKGDNVLIINSNATLRDKINTLAEAVKNFDLDRIYILPVIRELLEKTR
jgi:hypothetical protein